MQTSPQCIVRTLINCCLHSEATISFNVARKTRFCDGNATLDAGVCFATMTTESRRRREQVRAWKGQRGNFRHYLRKKTTERSCYQRGADSHCTCARMQNVPLRNENVHLSAPVRRVYFPFSGVCHSGAGTQQAHCLTLDVLHFKELGFSIQAGTSKSKAL